MRVSIIIPSFDQQQFLPEAIESAISQTEQCEVIVIDDKSTDNSLRIAQQYKPEVKVVQQVNKGLSSARNTGIMNATSEWIFPLDADDYISDDCIRKLLLIADQTNADIIAPSIQYFGESNDGLILQEGATRKDFLAGNRLPYACLIRKSALLEVGGYSSQMTFGWEDYHLWFDLLGRNKKLAISQEKLFFYRVKQQSMWRESTKHSKELWAQIFKDFPDLLPV